MEKVAAGGRAPADATQPGGTAAPYHPIDLGAEPHGAMGTAHLGQGWGTPCSTAQQHGSNQGQPSDHGGESTSAAVLSEQEGDCPPWNLYP